MQQVHDRLYVGDDTDCRTGSRDWSVVHACKRPYHRMQSDTPTLLLPKTMYLGAGPAPSANPILSADPIPRVDPIPRMDPVGEVGLSEGWAYLKGGSCPRDRPCPGEGASPGGGG